MDNEYTFEYDLVRDGKSHTITLTVKKKTVTEAIVRGHLFFKTLENLGYSVLEMQLIRVKESA